MFKKSPYRAGRVLAAAFLMGLGGGAAAESLSARQLFEQGIAAAHAGEDREALGLFRQARAAGLDSPTLWYNLGVTYFRLGDYRQSKSAFERLRRHPTLGPIAYFNLGLIAEKEGDRKGALAAYRAAREHSDDPRLQALATAHLDDVERTPPVSLWGGAVSLNRGHDDALVDPAEQTTALSGDQFNELFGLLSGIISGNPSRGWRLDLSAYALRYQSFDAYDLNLAHAGVSRLGQLGGWSTQLTAAAEQSTLGESDYLRSGSIGFQLARAPGPGTGYRLYYRYSAFDALDPLYDPQAGSQQQLDLEARWGNAARQVHLGYGVEVNDREDYSAPGVFSSYSPTRQRVFLGYRSDRGRWYWDGALEYRASRYAGTNTLLDGSRLGREDSRGRANVGVGYRLGTHWELRGQYSYTTNDSNIDTYDYDQNLASVGVGALF